MNLHIEPITDKHEWNEFIEELRPHSFLHTWNWGEFNKSLGHTIYRLGIFSGERLEGIALIIVIPARRAKFLFCPHGPLFRYNDPEQFTIFVEYVRKLGEQENASFVRVSPPMLDSESARKTFGSCGFRPAPIHMHVELAWILNIDTSESELLATMRKTTRYSIQRAQKLGVTVSIANQMEDVEKFYRIYQITTERQNFTGFSLDYLTKEFKAFADDGKALLFFGEYQSKIVSSAYVIFSNGSAFYHHGASTHEFPNIPVSHLVQWEAIREAKRRGMKFYNFWGIIPEGSPKNHPWTGLTLFKKGFGGFPEHYVHAQDLVMDSRYWFNYLVERMRKFRRRL